MQTHEKREFAFFSVQSMTKHNRIAPSPNTIRTSGIFLTNFSLAISSSLYYNSVMKRLTKLQTPPSEVVFDLPTDALSEPVKVQGGYKRVYQNVLLVESGGRYKLFCTSRDYIKFLAGEGHFKWARGETPFVCGDVFLAEEVGEYEINGNCTFTVVRQ